MTFILLNFILSVCIAFETSEQSVVFSKLPSPLPPTFKPDKPFNTLADGKVLIQDSTVWVYQTHDEKPSTLRTFKNVQFYEHPYLVENGKFYYIPLETSTHRLEPIEIKIPEEFINSKTRILDVTKQGIVTVKDMHPRVINISHYIKRKNEFGDKLNRFIYDFRINNVIFPADIDPKTPFEITGEFITFASKPGKLFTIVQNGTIKEVPVPNHENPIFLSPNKIVVTQTKDGKTMAYRSRHTELNTRQEPRLELIRGVDPKLKIQNIAGNILGFENGTFAFITKDLNTDSFHTIPIQLPPGEVLSVTYKNGSHEFEMMTNASRHPKRLVIEPFLHNPSILIPTDPTFNPTFKGCLSRALQ